MRISDLENRSMVGTMIVLQAIVGDMFSAHLKALPEGERQAAIARVTADVTANARQLVERGGAWLLPEAEFTPAILSGLLERVLPHPAALARAAAASFRLGEPEAAQRLATLVETVAREGWR